jgi:hypothetical protein
LIGLGSVPDLVDPLIGLPLSEEVKEAKLAAPSSDGSTPQLAVHFFKVVFQVIESLFQTLKTCGLGGAFHLLINVKKKALKFLKALFQEEVSIHPFRQEPVKCVRQAVLDPGLDLGNPLPKFPSSFGEIFPPLVHDDKL